MKKKYVFILTILITSFVNAQTITDGLVGYWSFNGGASDGSTNTNNGTISGATLTADRNGNPNSAYHFDGVDDYIDCGTASELQLTNLSVLAWVRFDALKANALIAWKTTNFGLGYKYSGVGNNQDEIGFSVHSGNGGWKNTTTTGGIQAGQTWYHVAGTFDGTTQKIYIDGVLVSSNAATNLTTPITNFWIGGHSGGDTFQGDIDDVLVYDRALDANEILEIISPTGLCDNIYCVGDNVGIGTDNTHGYRLAVAGSIITEEVKVKLQSSWPDFVFEEKYNLMSLEQIEKFISKNKHLPEIPSQLEVKKNGINLGDMDSKLLKKIEELTLHMINMNKEVQQLKKENEKLKTEVSSLKKKRDN